VSWGIVVSQTPTQGSLFAGRYRVGPVLGEGGLGVVLSAVDERTNEACALKVLAGVSSEHDRARLLREARALRLISSTHVVRVFDVDELDGVPFLVLERLEGQDLARLSADGEPIVAHRVASYAVQVCEALTQAHAAGIIHRDIKPSNLFLAKQPDGREIVKVLDVGISKAAPGDKLGAFTSSHPTLGSPQFISPEQLESAKSVDLRTDIWSLGAVMFRLLSGRYPFNGPTRLAIQQAIVLGQRERLLDVAPNVHSGLAFIVERCLDLDRDMRYASASDLAAALRPFAENATEMATVPDEEAPTREIVRERAPEPPRPAPYRFLVLALGVAVPVIVFLALPRRSPAPPIVTTEQPLAESSLAPPTSALPSTEPVLSSSSARPASSPVRASRPSPAPAPPPSSPLPTNPYR
jgi:serine/threonine-protein kinase